MVGGSSAPVAVRPPVSLSMQVLQYEPYPTRRAFNEMLASDPRVIANLVPLSYGDTSPLTRPVASHLRRGHLP